MTTPTQVRLREKSSRSRDGLLSGRFRANTEEMLGRSNVEVALRHGHRRQAVFADVVAGNFVVRFARPKNQGDAIFREDKDLAVRENGRRGMHTLQPLHPDDFAGGRFQAMQNVVASNRVNVRGDVEQRREC